MKQQWLSLMVVLGLCGPAHAQNSSQTLLNVMNTFTVVRDLHVHRNLNYGTLSRQNLDIYAPRTGNNHPVLVFVHGGTWRKYSKDDFKFVGESFARAGFVTVNINYRLSPEVQYPAFVEDTVKAFRWVKDHIQQYQGNPQNVFVMGHSAGAYNVVMALVHPRFLAAEGLKSTDFKGVIGLAGPYDIAPLDVIFDQNLPRREVMPVYHVQGQLPPFLLLSAEADDLVMPENAEHLAKALQDNGTPVKTVTVPSLTHSEILGAVMRRFSGNSQVRPLILDFLNPLK